MEIFSQASRIAVTNQVSFFKCILFALAMWCSAAVLSPAVAEYRVPELIETQCRACHGNDGVATVPDTPHLNSQHEPFLVLQLENYRSGERPHPVMAALSQSLTDDDIRQLARHYAGQPRAAQSEATVSNERGQNIYQQGLPQEGIPACQWCHGAEGVGLAPHYPLLAGQVESYLSAQIAVFQNEEHFENPLAWVMKAAVINLSEDDAAAVADYLSSL